MTPPKELADALAILDEQATPAPWEGNIAGIEGDNYVAATGPWHRVPNGNGFGSDERIDAADDAALIVALRNDAKLIVAALRLAEGFASYCEDGAVDGYDLSDELDAYHAAFDASAARAARGGAGSDSTMTGGTSLPADKKEDQDG